MDKQQQPEARVFARKYPNRDYLTAIMTQLHTRNDEEERRVILNNIDRHGCHLTLPEPDNYLPGFIYSIGLYQKFGHPELICFGLPTAVAAGILNGACKKISEGQVLETGRLYPGFLEGYEIQFLQVDKDFYPDYVGYAGWFYDTFDFPLLQLVWPDKQHHFPWDEVFNPNWKFKQPLLDRDTGFKFYEEKNLGVFTTGRHWRVSRSCTFITTKMATGSFIQARSLTWAMRGL